MEVLAKETSIEPTSEMVFYLGAYLYPKDARKNIQSLLPTSMTLEGASTIIDKLHDMRAIYTHEKMKQFCDIPELATLFMEFAKDPSRLSDSGHISSMETIVSLCHKL